MVLKWVLSVLASTSHLMPIFTATVQKVWCNFPYRSQISFDNVLAPWREMAITQQCLEICMLWDRDSKSAAVILQSVIVQAAPIRDGQEGILLADEGYRRWLLPLGICDVGKNKLRMREGGLICFCPDLHRTFPDNVQFQKTSNPCLQKALFNVLLAYGHHDKAVGYCQVPTRSTLGVSNHSRYTYRAHRALVCFCLLPWYSVHKLNPLSA